MPTAQERYIKSVNLNAQTHFPYLVLDVINDQSYPRNPGFRVMHWHEDVQFIYVLDGEIEIQTLDATVRVGKGSGLFINKGVVHLVRKTIACHYNSFIFPDYFLSFYVGSPAKAFVDGVVGRAEWPLCLFPQQEAWCAPVLAVLSRLAELENHKTEWYVYEVLCLLSQLWLAVCKHMPLPAKRSDTATQLRMQTFLQYISRHYAAPLSLDRLAAGAHVSKSECLRCFQATMQTTPYRYLMEFRLAKAGELLKNTDASIGEIAGRTGFGQVSHFGRCFKKKTGYTPREYRKRYTETGKNGGAGLSGGRASGCR